MKSLIRSILILSGVLLSGCYSSNINEMTPEQWVYYAVDYRSYEKDYPRSSIKREEIIDHIITLNSVDLKSVLNSPFIYPYMILKPAFTYDGNEKGLSTALALLDFLEQKGLDIYKHDSAGCSSVHMAISFKDYQVYEILHARYDLSKFKGNPNAKVPLCRENASELGIRKQESS